MRKIWMKLVIMKNILKKSLREILIPSQGSRRSQDHPMCQTQRMDQCSIDQTLILSIRKRKLDPTKTTRDAYVKGNSEHCPFGTIVQQLRSSHGRIDHS